jgi:hypothetical protein
MLWKDTLHEPSSYPKPPVDKLQLQLDLDFVHGYRIRGCRDNVFLSRTVPHSIIYPAGALGVTMDLISKKQQYFAHHTDDVICVAYDDVRGYIATGQVQF